METVNGTTAPKVSVIIPAYNQADFLDDALQSALSQDYAKYEVVVVNDGSTDRTEEVARRYEGRIRYLYQENQGLAGARNTGILAARGEYVALLDSDDIWDATFLSEMMALAEREPEATVYYCGIRYMDRDRQPLSQTGGTTSSSGSLFRAILRANFLIPSTILMKRQPVLDAGLFDVKFRRLQDLELWVRLFHARHTFAGLNDRYLVRYRVHGANLSTDAQGGEQALRWLTEKHFGVDDGDYAAWSEEKRWAYGAFYRYCLVNPILRGGGWQGGAESLRKALLADPSLAGDMGFFYDLALGDQPAGFRGSAQSLKLRENAARVASLLEEAFQPPAPAEIAALHREASGTAFYALGLLAYNTLDLTSARRFLSTALLRNPTLLHDGRIVKTLLKSFLSLSAMRRLREYAAQKQRDASPER